MKKNESAFPYRSRWDAGNESFDLEESGMSLRDYFAAKAMQAIIANIGIGDKPDIHKIVNITNRINFNIAEFSYKIADKMLEERSRSNE